MIENEKKDKDFEVYNMLILGNGFDLAHKLETSYGEFLDSIKDESDNQWIRYFKRSKYKLHDKDNWIDFENEIGVIIKYLEQNKDDLKNQTEYLEKIGFSFEGVNNINGIIKLLEKDLDNLIVELNNYLRKIEECTNFNLVEEITEIADKIDFVLSFNYTHTYKRFYQCTNTDYHYIHGQTSSEVENNNMILGINEYLSNKDKKSDYIYFKKYFQRIYKKTGNKYMKWINRPYRNNIYDLFKNESENKFNIYIFGHSLDVTDGDILKYIILRENTDTTIYYYNEKAYRDQINNLVEILGQEKLIECVSGANPCIKFIKQSGAEVNQQEYFKRDRYLIENDNDEKVIENFIENVKAKNKNYLKNKDIDSVVEASFLFYKSVMKDITIEDIFEFVDNCNADNYVYLFSKKFAGESYTHTFISDFFDKVLIKFPDLEQKTKEDLKGLVDRNDMLITTFGKNEKFKKSTARL